jgi:hypothetical protein
VQRTSIALALLCLTATPAAADDVDGIEPHVALAARLANDGAFTPTVARAGHGDGAAVIVSSQWDGARDRATLDVGGELQIWGPIRVVARVADVTREDARPGAGVGVAILDEARHGVASTAYLVYKAEGWTAPEGEIEAQLAFGRKLGPVRGTAAIAYGQDPEGDDRDGELALAAHVAPLDALVVGVAGRYRDALGSKAEETIMKRELIGGATATYTFDRFAISALAGVVAVETATVPWTTGPAATLSVGAAF